MNQLDSVQTEKQKIFEENLIKDLRTYVKKSRLVVNAVSRKIENQFEREGPTLPDELKSRLLAALNVEVTYSHVSTMMQCAVNYALRRRAQTQQEKSFWNTPWWRAEFDEDRFLDRVKNCEQAVWINESIHR